MGFWYGCGVPTFLDLPDLPGNGKPETSTLFIFSLVICEFAIKILSLLFQIRKKSKAHAGGLQEGDVLLRLNGVPVKGKTHEAVMHLVDNAGDKLSVDLQR